MKKGIPNNEDYECIFCIKKVIASTDRFNLPICEVCMKIIHDNKDLINHVVNITQLSNLIVYFKNTDHTFCCDRDILNIKCNRLIDNGKELEWYLYEGLKLRELGRIDKNNILRYSYDRNEQIY